MHGQTVLHYAAESIDERELVEYLLKQPGVPINARDTYGVTPLAWAANRRPGPERDWAINLLIRYGASIKKKDIWGVTPADKIRGGVPIRQYIWGGVENDAYSHWRYGEYMFWDQADVGTNIDRGREDYYESSSGEDEEGDQMQLLR